MIINENVNGAPLYESNLNDVLSLVKEIRISFPEKIIWLYSGFTWEECHPFSEEGILKPDDFAPSLQVILKKRWEIISNVDVFVDGEYIDEQRNLSKKWAGSDNQRVISVVNSLDQGKIVLYCD